jgi:hypothetical protein
VKALLLVLAAAAPLLASSTATWEMSSYQDFQRGEFHNLSLSRDGTIALAPRLDDVFSSGQAVIWSVAAAPDGSLYLGTGNRGRLYRYDSSKPNIKPELVWTSDQPEIFAVAVAKDGTVYAGTSPDGKIYSIRSGKAELYFDPHAKYIWSLAIAPDGVVYAGTGGEGKIYRITGPKTGEEYYSTGQQHVTDLTLDNQGRLLAGTEPNGILYRVTAKGKAFALYNANLPEVRALASGDDGSIYAVGMGGSVNRKAQSAAQAAQAMLQSGSTPIVTTSITVAANADEQAGLEAKPPGASPTAGQAAAANAAIALAAANPQSIETPGVEKSAIYRIRPDNTVDTLWSSKEENVFDLLPASGGLLFATDAGGRIYRLTPDRKLTLVAQTNEGETTRLVSSHGAVFAATGNMGKLFELDSGTADKGSYESPIFDAQSVARWGRVQWTGAGHVALQTRTGNSLRPDGTWSDWSEPVTDSSGGQITSPNARFIQWKAELAKGGGESPKFENFTLAYLPENTPPVIKSIIVTTSAASSTPSSRSSSSTGVPANNAYSITVSDTGDAGPATSTGTPTQTVSRAASQQLIVSWQAEDSDGDRLEYSVWFRGQGEHDWKLLKTALHDTSISIEGDALADGRYLFRVVASDAESNPPDHALTAELISSPVLIDNTPPVVHVASSKRDGRNAVIDFDATDATSALRRCDYSVDAGPWMAINSADGVIDSPHEQFHLTAPVPAGEHVLVLRAVDSGGNAGLAKVVIE